ncbi:sigma-70 family RNA polymerase sigma factor [bacterium]|nr:sigma-70 family RNA polymerase sigma factor [bacterium]
MSSDKKLIDLLVSNFPKGWNLFISEYTDLVYSVISYQLPPTLKDEDTASDIYLFVMRHLMKLDFTKFKFKCKLSTWLVAIVKNLIKDYYRKQFGRRSEPKAIENLDEFEKRVFFLYYNEGYFDSFQIFEILRIDFPDHNYKDVKKALDKLNDQLSDSLKERYIENAQSPAEVSLDAVLVEEEESTYSDDQVETNPESMLLEKEKNQLKDEKLRFLSCALNNLPRDEQVIIKLRFYNNLSAKEIAQKLNIEDYRKLYHKIQKIMEKLKFIMENFE